jgi:hypothetical protein
MKTSSQKKASRKKSAPRTKARRSNKATPKARPFATDAIPRAFAAPAPAVDGIPWDLQFDDNDVPGLNGPATTGFQRHTALQHVVTNVWTNEDISLVQRVESGGRFLWVMWRRNSMPPA